jgi:hypothetical protein
MNRHQAIPARAYRRRRRLADALAIAGMAVVLGVVLGAAWAALYFGANL